MSFYKSDQNETQKKYGSKNYYDYAAYRSLNLINSSPKIVTPYQANYNKFALISEEKHSTINETDVITLIIKEKFRKKFDWFYLLSVLNSELIQYYSSKINKKVYNLLDFRSNQIASFPIKSCTTYKMYETLAETISHLIDANIKSDSFRNDLSLIKDIQNYLVYEVHFRENLSTILHSSLSEYMETVELDKLKHANAMQVYETCKRFLNEKPVKRDIIQLNNLSEIREIKKTISS